jgi:predicted acylesterase/phospholipase RssA
MLASMALPLIYPPVISPSGNMWVDGGILENYPIARFSANTTLGFDFTSSSSVKADTLINFVLRVMAVQQAPLDFVAWKSLSNKHKKNTVLIDTGKMSFIKAIADDVNVEAREEILRAGKDAIFQKILEWETQDSSNQTNLKENVFRNLLNNGPSFLHV